MTDYAYDIANMNWDEYRLAVEDEMMMEIGDLPSDDDATDIYAAFDAGMSPWGCAAALCEARAA